MAPRKALRPHPARDQILDVMRSYGKPISPNQLARITGQTLGSASYHVRTLLSAGILRLADEGRVRGTVEHFYTLVPDKGEDEVRVADPVSQLLSLCGAATLPDPEGGYPLPTTLDDEARERLTAVIEKVRPMVLEIAVAATERAAGGTRRG
jgi:DNA-binding transcriptional ArsR family regulator